MRGALALTPARLAGATLCFLAVDLGAREAGASAWPGGPLDEAAHLLTTLLVLWAFGSRLRRFLVPALIASVAIDIDHIPGQLGSEWLTAGTPRPYTHSLLTIVIVLGVALIWRRRRTLWLGVAIGLALHFGRDMGEGGAGVSLLWPFSRHGFQYPHGYYLAVMAGFVMLGAHRLSRRRHPVRSSRRRDLPITRSSP